MKFFTSLFFLALTTASFANVTFLRDSRPADGDKAVLTIKNAESRGEAEVLLTSTFNRMRNAQASTKVIVDERSMDCKFLSSKNKLQKVVCSDDRRPADGALIVITVKRNSYGTYDVSQSKTIVSRMTAQETTTVTKLTHNLKLVKF